MAVGRRLSRRGNKLNGTLGQRLEELLGLIHEKLKAVTYRFKPARRVLIPKEGTSCANLGYLAGTSHSVGRGWPFSHFLPDFK